MENERFDITKELSDEELDEFYKELQDLYAEDEDCQKISVINPVRMKEMLFVYNVANKIAKSSGAKISYKVNEPFDGMGCVSVVGKKIEVNNTPMFIEAIKRASNFEAYPKINGTTCMTFTFHRLISHTEQPGQPGGFNE